MRFLAVLGLVLVLALGCAQVTDEPTPTAQPDTPRSTPDNSLAVNPTFSPDCLSPDELDSFTNMEALIDLMIFSHAFLDVHVQSPPDPPTLDWTVDKNLAMTDLSRVVTVLEGMDVSEIPGRLRPIHRNAVQVGKALNLYWEYYFAFLETDDPVDDIASTEQLVLSVDILRDLLAKRDALCR